MARRETPLGSEDSPLLRFAGDLRRLRQRAGLPTYRELGRRANYSAAALSEAVSGRRLPSLAVTTAFVRACDGEVGEWAERWRELAAAVPRASEETTSPYVGLAAFQVEDADRFFGRGPMTQTLLALVDQRAFVGVFGASGAGKSSLLRAGLVARTQRTAVVVTPGADPTNELAVAIAGPADEPASRIREDLAANPEALRGWLAKTSDDLVLVVDQFEEVFTLCEEADRRWLIRALTSAAGPRTRVVIGIRADFYGHCSRHPELVTALHQAQVLVGPMSTDELRRAICEPATRAGASVEAALLARLISDADGRAAALPLVSHALAETWRRRRGLVLSLASYQDVGGIEHALTRTAERTFDRLTDDEQAAARLLFLRLLVPGDNIETTKRRVRREDLHVADALLDRLAAARLISIDHDSVELAHEALLRAWPRLAGWIEEDREALRAHHRLTEATAVWEAHDRDPDTLYRGARLEQATQLTDRLNPRERDFLTAGVAAEHARTDAERRAARRLRRLAAGLAALVVLLAVSTALAIHAQRTADRQRGEALSMRAIDAAGALLSTRPADAAALALASYRIAPTTEAREMLTLAHAAADSVVVGDGLLTAPGRRVTVALDKLPDDTFGQRLWQRDGATWRRAAALPRDGSGFSLLSADERRLVTWHEYHTTLWDVTDPDHPRVIPLPAGMPPIYAMDRTGALMASSVSGRAFVWRIGDRVTHRLPVTGVEAVALFSDGVLLGRRDGGEHTIEQWTLDGKRVATLMRAPYPLEPHPGPGGRVLVTSDPGEMTLLDATDPREPRILARRGGVNRTASVAFDEDGGTVAVAHDSGVQLWDARSGTPLLSVRTTGLRLDGPRIEPGGRAVMVLDDDSARAWRFDADFDRVIRQTCAGPVSVDWQRYFPGSNRPSLCP